MSSPSLGAEVRRDVNCPPQDAVDKLLVRARCRVTLFTVSRVRDLCHAGRLVAVCLFLRLSAVDTKLSMLGRHVAAKARF